MVDQKRENWEPLSWEDRGRQGQTNNIVTMKFEGLETTPVPPTCPLQLELKNLSLTISECLQVPMKSTSSSYPLLALQGFPSTERNNSSNNKINQHQHHHSEL